MTFLPSEPQLVLLSIEYVHINLLVRLLLASSSAFLGAGFGALPPPLGPKKDRISEGIVGVCYYFGFDFGEGKVHRLFLCHLLMLPGWEVVA